MQPSRPSAVHLYVLVGLCDIQHICGSSAWSHSALCGAVLCYARLHCAESDLTELGCPPLQACMLTYVLCHMQARVFSAHKAGGFWPTVGQRSGEPCKTTKHSTLTRFGWAKPLSDSAAMWELIMCSGVRLKSAVVAGPDTVAAVHHAPGQCQHFSPSTCALGPERSQLCLCHSDQRGALHGLPAVWQRQCSSPESAAPLGCASHGAAAVGGYSGLLVRTLLCMHTSSCPCTRLEERFVTTVDISSIPNYVLCQECGALLQWLFKSSGVHCSSCSCTSQQQLSTRQAFQTVYCARNVELLQCCSGYACFDATCSACLSCSVGLPLAVCVQILHFGSATMALHLHMRAETCCVRNPPAAVIHTIPHTIKHISVHSIIHIIIHNLQNCLVLVMIRIDQDMCVCDCPCMWCCKPV